MPYQPFFVNQVTANNVRDISSTGDSIEGTLKQEATYTPPGGGDPAKVSNDFKTEVPSFIDSRAVTDLLTQHHVVINASSPDSGRSVIGTIILRFLPTVLLIGFFLWLIRRQSGGGGGGILGGFGRSTARRVQADSQDRVTFKDVAGIDEAEQELEEIVDFSETRSATPSSGRASPTACSCTARLEPARRCSRAPWLVRPMPPTSTYRPRSS